ncbi:hypothetical protein C9374_009101 [Naegleria lovaniensis]|uniref:Uncharacterized protein n=1 Tax=Naegleria lovaniensis TaxID=51637 RepID=A0AA88GIU2_NAELO|nr:uncharacterized protein C9374_009101 [Naegleria lovaniensis]KAG2377585.1 hypothetical protein C9374_009101 [Naegleria lovaniensis]
MITESAMDGLTLLSSVRDPHERTLNVECVVLRIKRFHIDSHFLHLADIHMFHDKTSNTSDDIGVSNQPTTNSFQSLTHSFIPKDAFELTVTDGTMALIIILSPVMNSMIIQSQIKEHTLIRITKFKVLMDEKVKGKQKRTIFIHSLEVVSQNNLEYSLDDFTEILDEEKGNIRPIMSERGYYMPLLDDDNFDFEMFTGTVPQISLEDPTPDETCQLAEIIASSKRNSFFARIYKKSKIRYYGKTYEEKSYPMFYTLLITDKSTPKGVPVTIWNDLALHSYAELNVGDIIIVNDYRVKQFFDSGVFTVKFKNEISINSSKTEQPIQKIDPKQLEDIKEFAPLSFPVSTINEIMELSLSDTTVNILGVVVNVGPYRREKFHSQFSQYKYLTLVDPSSVQMMSVKLFTNSRKSLLDSVQVGQVIFISDLRVKQISTSIEDDSDKFIFLESTFVTHFFTEEYLKGSGFFSIVEHSNDMKTQVEAIFSWRNKTRKIIRKYMDCSISDFDMHGVSREYPLPEYQDLESFKKAHPTVKWIYFKELFEIPSTLVFEENQIIIVKCIINDIQIERQQKRKRSQNDSTPGRNMKSPSKNALMSDTLNSHNTFEQYSETSSEPGYTLLRMETESVNGDRRLDLVIPVWNMEFTHPSYTSLPEFVNVLDEHLEVMLQHQSTDSQFDTLDQVVDYYRQAVNGQSYICVVEILCVGHAECKYFVNHMFKDEL